MKFKHLVLLIALFSSAFSIAQFVKQKSDLPALGISYGQKIFQENFYNQVNAFDAYSFKTSVQYVGVNVFGIIAIGRNFNIDGCFSFSMMLPRKITISDTIEGRMSGFNIGIPLVGLDLLGKMENVDLLMYAGLNMGRTRMFQNELIRQKNPYISPQISLCPRIKVGRIALSLNIGYEYDISKTRWHRTFLATNDKTIINNFRQSGLTTSFTVGFVLG